ncbi:hypothetical protein FD23_GL000489 [Lactobacillus delbrueckii subsp. delbrueckii DSM 20074 = JCM 1012]|nr:hypothetical protein FD23_GL000489 [Lactobacillus delbrueckii subsp. delbrueckii DSM 20074 = JCM 1012]
MAFDHLQNLNGCYRRNVRVDPFDHDLKSYRSHLKYHGRHAF